MQTVLNFLLKPKVLLIFPLNENFLEFVRVERFDEGINFLYLKLNYDMSLPKINKKFTFKFLWFSLAVFLESTNIGGEIFASKM